LHEAAQVREPHHDLPYLFTTLCIEGGVDIPTRSQWPGNEDGGALATRNVQPPAAQAQLCAKNPHDPRANHYQGFFGSTNCVPETAMDQQATTA
jgi:hypothetical protein